MRTGHVNAGQRELTIRSSQTELVIRLERFTVAAPGPSPDDRMFQSSTRLTSDWPATGSTSFRSSFAVGVAAPRIFRYAKLASGSSGAS